MQFEQIRLDKSMYRHEGGFSACLEALDPSSAYRGTALEGLDAFERQLKRFDIKVKGAGSSAVSKFFSTVDSAALFPEYVSRAVAQGARDSGILEEIIAARAEINSLDYRSIATDVEDVQSGGNILDPVAEGAEIPEVNIKLSSRPVKLQKRGRLLQASYEAIKFQRIDVFSVALAQIGNGIAKAQLRDAVAVLTAADAGAPQEIAVGGAKVTYADLLALWGSFEEFDMDVILASPDMALEILAVDELKSPLTGIGFQQTGLAGAPLGAKLLRSSAVPAGCAIALDKDFALEMVSAGGIVVEYDKLIDSQLERAAITAISGFNRIYPGAVKLLKK